LGFIGSCETRPLPPKGRDGLATAIARVEGKQADAILTAYRSMISPRAEEYGEVASDIEKAGGFLVVRHAARQGAQ
jgi:hypothetical protein